MVFESILDPIFSPLLKLPSLLAVILISFALSLLVNLVYKFVTDQNLMKSLREEMKEHQKKIKEHKDDPKKMLEIQKKAMQSNLQYMMHSMKPTLFTMIPIIIIFGWLNSNFSYEPINSGDKFTTTAAFKEGISGKVELIVPDEIEILDSHVKNISTTTSWELMARKQGEFILEYKFDGQRHIKDVLITDKKNYKKPETKIKDSNLTALRINNKQLKLLNLFGFKIGWLGTYIIFSIIFSLILRKVMKIY